MSTTTGSCASCGIQARGGGVDDGNAQTAEHRKSFGSVDVIKGVDIDIEDGEFVVFVGPSGCGKSTLLRMIAGLEDITSGTLEIDGKVVNDLPPKERGIAMVFQTYAIFPHMTVRENMAFGLTIAKARQGREGGKGRRGRPHPADGTPAGPAALAAVGRPAPACRHRPRHRARPQGLPVRRAAVEPRRGAAHGHAHGDRQAAPGPRRHDDLRHPRPGRGDDAGRQDRGAEGRAW